MKLNDKSLGYLIFGGLVLIFIVFKKFNSSDHPAEKRQPETVENAVVLREIRKEPKVREAIITDANVLYVSVDDDGTKRDGYASYICEILAERKSSVKRVKVVKVNSTNDPGKDNAYGVLLGESWCK